MKKVSKICTAVIGAALVGAVPLLGGASAVAEKQVLFDIDRVFYIEKQASRDFTILQFTDTHIPSANEGVRSIFPVMKSWVEQTDPDLIVITGDGVNGTADGNDMKGLIAAMNGYEKPWAYIFGNHEKDGGLGIAGNSALLKAEAERDGTYLLYDENSMKGNGSEQDDRYGNYVINVMQKKSLVYSLFMFDSAREYRTFLPKQVQWYSEGVKKLSEQYFGKYAPFEGKVIPSMVFHHVPTDEYQYAANAVLSQSYEFKEEDGSLYTYKNVKVGEVPAKYGSGANYEFAYGMRDGRVKNKRIHKTQADRDLLEYAMYEDMRSEDVFFSVAKDLHSTTHAFCGHRHTNDATITYEGITLTFGTKTGPGNSKSGAATGCTVITIANKGGVTVTHKYDKRG